MYVEFARDGRCLLHMFARHGDRGEGAPLFVLSYVKSLAAQYRLAGSSDAEHPGELGDASREGRDADDNYGSVGLTHAAT